MELELRLLSLTHLTKMVLLKEQFNPLRTQFEQCLTTPNCLLNFGAKQSVATLISEAGCAEVLLLLRQSRTLTTTLDPKAIELNIKYLHKRHGQGTFPIVMTNLDLGVAR